MQCKGSARCFDFSTSLARRMISRMKKFKSKEAKWEENSSRGLGVQRVVRRGEERCRGGKYVVIRKGKWSYQVIVNHLWVILSHHLLCKNLRGLPDNEGTPSSKLLLCQFLMKDYSRIVPEIFLP